MFAGAAREAVFSRARVIRRVNAEFVPVALKAALVNNPPNDPEGRLYQEISRSKPAPQGICVVNSAGKVLDWALMFDDDESVLAFLDHALKRFRDHPDAKRPVAAERYMKFPSMKLPDVADDGEVLPVPDRHSETGCPAQARFRPGTIIAHLFGRALGPDGRPVPDTVRQEQYVEDRFDLSIEAQALLAKQFADSGAARFRLPDELARQWVSHAYLGQIDVNPLGSPTCGGGDLKQCEFWAQADNPEGTAPLRLRIEGKTEVAGSQEGSRPDGRSDGRLWEHAVRLTWEGFIEMQGRGREAGGRSPGVTRLLLAAHGSERLKWGNASFPGGSDVAHLPGGHPIDLACEVRYGVIGEPVSANEVGAAGPPSLALAGDAGLQARLQRKMQQVQAGVQKWQQEGRDPSRVGEIMQGFEPLMREGRLQEAEAVLDRALKLLGSGRRQE